MSQQQKPGEALSAAEQAKQHRSHAEQQQTQGSGVDQTAVDQRDFRTRDRDRAREKAEASKRGDAGLGPDPKKSAPRKGTF